MFGRVSIISKRIRNCLLEFETINERIDGFRIKGRIRNLYIICAHAPTKEQEENEMEVFYDKLEWACRRAQRYDILTVIGNFNTKLGKENIQRQVTGKYTLHNVTSGNGVMLTEFAVSNNLVIKRKSYKEFVLELEDA
jgi:hypothetical protein